MAEFIPIGIIHTPYTVTAPFRQDESDPGKFRLEILPELREGLKDLERFSHLIVLYHFDRQDQTSLIAHPPNHPGKVVGVFASRSPKRINKIGLNIVKIKAIEGNTIHTSPLDALDGTPILDIKPYIPDLDCFTDATNGWAGK